MPSLPFFAATAGGAALLTGFSVLAGWLFHFRGLHAVHPALGTMAPHAAFCLVLTGAALWILSVDGRRGMSRRVAYCCAATVVLASVLTLGVNLFGWTVTIDQRLFHGAIGTAFPGRMPTPSALVFLSLGLALLLVDVEIREWRPAEFLAFLAALISLLALIAYAYGFVSIFDVPRRRPLAFHSVLLLLSLSFGVLIVRPDRGLMGLATSEGVTGVMVRRLLPAAVGIPVFVGWLVMEGQRGGLYPPNLSVAYFALLIVVVFSVLILRTAIWLHRSDEKRQQAEDHIRGLNALLERRVAERTVRLETANKELEAFSYSVSHDLRAPLRAIDGFSQMLIEDCSDQLGNESQGHLHRIRAGAQRMSELIDGLLGLARITRSDMRREHIDVSGVAEAIVEELRQREPGRGVRVIIEPGVRADGDAGLVRIALENLLANAWKFTRGRSATTIEVGTIRENGETVYFVRDNGAGFEMEYAHKLFGAFQRLHAATEFEGTGIGLATVQRIVHRHGGRVWAEGAVERGATLFFTLGP